MFDSQLAEELLDKLAEKGVQVNPGLSEEELGRVEQALGVKMPPDLAILLRAGLPQSPQGDKPFFPDWRKNPEEEIKTSKEDLAKAFLFDIENNDYWCPLFGEKPQDLEAAKKQTATVLESWPPLVRLYGHRFMPTQPSEVGNPILSVWQPSDTVYYGNNLVDYFVKEFDVDMEPPAGNDQHSVPYWGEAFGL